MSITISIEVDRINSQLINHFGIDTSTGKPMWKVVWSDDQLEMRKMDFNDNGVPLLYPEVREVKKFAYIEHKWILVQLVAVPEVCQEELAGAKLSYECLFIFETETGQALPPNFEACQFVIDLVNATKGKGNLSKYKDNSDSPEVKEKRINKLCEELFGDENATTDALAYREGVGYTGPSKIEPAKES